MLCQVMIEHLDVEFEISAAVDRQYAIAKKVIIRGLAVRGEAHHLPLVAIEHVKADIVCHGRVELAERMGQFDAFEDVDMVAATTAKKGGRVFARSVPCQYRGRIKWRNKESGCGVGLVVLDIVKLKIARAEMLSQTLWMTEHL